MRPQHSQLRWPAGKLATVPAVIVAFAFNSVVVATLVSMILSYVAV